MTVREILKAWKKQAKEMDIMDKEVELGIRETGVLFFIEDDSIKFVMKGNGDIYERKVIEAEVRKNRYR
jgi:hypothetical protein